MKHRRRHRWSWRTWIGATLVGVLAALLVSAAVVISVQHIKLEPVLSGSMRPGIQPGDLAVIRPVPAGDLRVGDVIAYLPPHEATPVLHRIVSINSDGLVTKGDANNVADPWGRVKPKDPTVERLVMTIPKVGFLTDIKRLLLIIAGCLLLIVAVVALWPEKRRPEESDPEDNPDPEVDDGSGSEMDSVADSSGDGDDDHEVIDEPHDSPTPELTPTKGEVTT